MIETCTDNHVAERFELTIDDDLAAWIDYELGPGVLALNHTEVAPSFRGRGIASDLVEFALAHAKVRGLRVAANCSFVASFVERHTEYGGLVV